MVQEIAFWLLMSFRELPDKREAEAVALKEQSPIGLKIGSLRALQRPLPFQPDASASGDQFF